MNLSDMSLQPLENKALSWGVIRKYACILAEITIRKSQILTTSVERRLNTAPLGAGSTEMMQDHPLHVLEQAAISSPWRRWATESLLPWVYWEHQAAHTRCTRRKTKIRQVWESVRAALHQHALTLRLPAQALEDWHTWATQRHWFS
jgi:hypothetical protein